MEEPAPPAAMIAAMSEDIRLEALHLQLTRACDLRCRMCGQWGENGYQAGRPAGGGMQLADWLAVLEAAAPLSPRITLWGGEPLLAPEWPVVARRASDLGMEALLITNGTRLATAATAMSGLFAWIYVSVDGPAEVHDHLRGRAGTFGRIAAGVRRLRESCPGQRICVMTTLVAENRGRLAELAPILAAWGVDGWLLAPQMFLSPARATAYAAFQAGLGCARSDGGSWVAEFPAGFGALWRDEVAAMQAAWPDLAIRLGPPGLPVHELADWYDRPDADLAPQHCWAPFRRLSIRADGSTNACLDIADGTLGDIRTASPQAILAGAPAERFRAAIRAFANPACRRCAWRWHGADYRHPGP
jgi:hypothetical protein